mmetsp:Transcript_25597/g.80134  ORF Transcript_25597/g.80134 Transcript_25597/m.80134 type:complete len:217 (+) Transcript_25597:1541-2191(+)
MPASTRYLSMSVACDRMRSTATPACISKSRMPAGIRPSRPRAWRSAVENVSPLLPNGDRSSPTPFSFSSVAGAAEPSTMRVPAAPGAGGQPCLRLPPRWLCCGGDARAPRWLTSAAACTTSSARSSMASPALPSCLKLISDDSSSPRRRRRCSRCCGCCTSAAGPVGASVREPRLGGLLFAEPLPTPTPTPPPSVTRGMHAKWVGVTRVSLSARLL